jgi:hypothetical protein
MGFGSDTEMIKTLLRLKETFNYDIFVETGTDKGHSLNELRFYFSKMYSCEIMEDRWENYQPLFDTGKIEIKLGTSIEWLPKFFTEIGHDKFFLFLDAHWYNNWPILDELRIVAEFGYKPVIIIHDFDNGLGFQYDSARPFQHLGDETEVSMNFEHVKESIEKIYGENGYIFETNTKCGVETHPVGCAYFYPKQ